MVAAAVAQIQAVFHCCLRVLEAGIQIRDSEVQATAGRGGPPRLMAMNHGTA